jgi:hypothetical protein
MEKNYPLILVFYLDAELMKNKEIMAPFTNSVNNILAQKNANAIAFFLPTTEKEKIECLNPVVIKEADMEKINSMVEDIKRNFSIDSNISLTPETICKCGKNENGSCQCN